MKIKLNSVIIFSVFIFIIIIFYSSDFGVNFEKNRFYIKWNIKNLYKPIFFTPINDKNNFPEYFFADFYIEKKYLVQEITIVFKDEDYPFFLIDFIYDFYRSLKYLRVKDIETFKIYYTIEDKEIFNNILNFQKNFNSLYINFLSNYKENSSSIMWLNSKLLKLYKDKVNFFTKILNNSCFNLTKINFNNVYSKNQTFYTTNVKHFDAVITSDLVKFVHQRPLIYINTWNHMFSIKNSNLNFILSSFSQYILYYGNRRYVEHIFTSEIYNIKKIKDWKEKNF